MAMTDGVGYQPGKEEQGIQLEFIDIERAYLQAPARRELYVKLPDEVAEPGTRQVEQRNVWGARCSAQLGMGIQIVARRMGNCSWEVITVRHVSQEAECKGGRAWR